MDSDEAHEGDATEAGGVAGDDGLMECLIANRTHPRMTNMAISAIGTASVR